MDSAAFPRFRFAIDRGGTFCDCLAEIVAADGTVQRQVVKLLSEHPECVQQGGN